MHFIPSIKYVVIKNAQFYFFRTSLYENKERWWL